MSSFVVGLDTDSLVYQAVWTFGLEKNAFNQSNSAGGENITICRRSLWWRLDEYVTSWFFLRVDRCERVG